MPRQQLKCRLSQIVPRANDGSSLLPFIQIWQRTSLPPAHHSFLPCSLGLNASAKLNDNIFDTDSCQMTVCSACHGNLSSLPKCLVRCAPLSRPFARTHTYTLPLSLFLSFARFRRDLTPLSCQFGCVILKTYTKWVKKRSNKYIACRWRMCRYPVVKENSFVEFINMSNNILYRWLLPAGYG